MPIGQGFFAIEHFKDLTVVFNCGGSKISLINREIDNIIFRKNKINALFITDLQNNYTNGLEYLLSDFDVENIIIPYMNKDEKLYTLALHLLYGKAKNDILTSILTGKNISVNIIEIVASAIFEFTSLSNSINDNWVFYCHNFRNKSKVKKFIKALDNYNLDLTLENIENASEKTKNLLKKIFREEVGEIINCNTLVVYSGPRLERIQDYSIDSFERKLHRGGCLYLGDYDTNKKKNYHEFYESFYNYNDFVGTITLPQHGFRNFYNQRLCLDFDARFVATCSKKFINRFPNKEVLRSIIYYNKPLYIIDETTAPFQLIIGDENL